RICSIWSQILIFFRFRVRHSEKGTCILNYRGTENTEEGIFLDVLSASPVDQPKRLAGIPSRLQGKSYQRYSQHEADGKSGGIAISNQEMTPHLSIVKSN